MEYKQEKCVYVCMFSEFVQLNAFKQKLSNPAGLSADLLLYEFPPWIFTVPTVKIFNLE